MTSTCTVCSRPLAADAQICHECGAPVPVPVPDAAGGLAVTRVRELFDQAMAIDPAQRETWLWSACQYHESLFQEVRSLLDAAAAAPSTKTRGATTGPYIGVYKLLRELGRGGMGVVHLAVRDDGAFRKNVAVKLLLRENVTPEFVLRFKQERQVLAALDHPNIARILDGGDAPDGMPYYVMEYVDGQPADQYCDTQRLSLTGRIKIFQQMCQAVQYLHQNSILHRDLKPANILVSTEGVVKLLDFGIAKLFGAGAFTNSDVTSVQGQLMTPGYASPEQMNGAPLQAASDIYALGTILYLLLTGGPPFSGLEEKMAKLASRQGPTPPSANIRQDLQATESTAQLRRSMLGQLDSIVLKTLRVDPRDRYASAADLATDLQRFLDGQPVAAHRETVAKRSFRILRRGRAAIAAGVVFLLLAGFGAWQWQRVQQEQAEAAVREAEVSARETQLRALLDQLEKRLAAAAAQSPAVADRIEDVGKLKQAFAKDYTAIAARSAGNDPLMNRAIRYLDRVHTAGPSAPKLGLEVADAYQQLGVLQESAPATRKAALSTYRKAAVTLASCPVDSQVLERMAMLRERAQKLGGTLEEPPAALPAALPVAPAPAPETAPVVSRSPLPAPRTPGRPEPVPVRADPVPAPAEVAPAPAPVPRPSPNAAPPAGIPASLMAELQDDLAGAETRIQTAEATLAPLIANLAQQGHTLNSDTMTAMSRMKTMLDKGRREMAAGHAAAAKESFAIARALADKVMRSVGR